MTLPPAADRAEEIAPDEEARTYPVQARFSNGAGLHQPDRKPDVRGVALKARGRGLRRQQPGAAPPAPLRPGGPLPGAGPPARGAAPEPVEMVAEAVLPEEPAPA